MTSANQRVIYAISSGEYSDYNVHCSFERKEDAERFVAAGMGDCVEELTLFASMPQIYTVYSARINTEGTRFGELVVTSYPTTVEPTHQPMVSNWGFQASGPDRERVVKSVVDRYTAWKAREQGIA